MANIRLFLLAAAAAVGSAASAPPEKDALVNLETSAHMAWQSKDAKFWDTFLWDRFIGNGSSGRLDKTLATKQYTGADCDIKSFALSEEQIAPLGNDAVLVTYKVNVDGTCGVQAVPENTRAASVYIRDGDQWKAAFHAEAPIVDPKAAPTTPVDLRETPTPVARDAGTDAMLAAEKTVWEAWRVHDAKKLAELTAREISFINICGTYFATKADALKDWAGTGCDVKSVSVTDAAGTMLSSTAGILTFKGGADGTCYGQTVGPIWGTSIYVKDGDTWKWAFGINIPALR